MISLYEIQNYIVEYGPLIKFITPIIMGVFAVVVCYFRERNKSELAKDVDTNKHQLQVKQLKIKQRSNIYRELFERFKHAEKQIGYLFGVLFTEKINPNWGDWDERVKISSNAKQKLSDFLMINLPFLSSEVKQLASDLDSKLDRIWTMCLSCKVFNNAKLEDKKYLDEVKAIMQTLEQQMKIEREATEKN